MKKTFILSYFTLLIFTYVYLIYQIIILKDIVDFAMFYYAGKHFLAHASIYSATPWHLFHIPHFINAKEVFFQLPIQSLGVNYSFNLNPPVFSLITFWLAYFPYPFSAALWAALIFGAAAGVVALLYRVFFLEKSFLAYLIFLEIFLASLFFQTNILLFQLGTPTALATIGVWYLARKNKEISAGTLLGLILSIKYFFGLIALLFLLQKRWRCIFASLAVFMVLNTLALVWVGKSALIQYQEIIHHVVWYANDWNASLFGFFARLSSAAKNGHFSAPTWVFMLTFFCSVALILYQIYLCRKPFLNKLSFDVAFSYVLIISMLIVPLAWVYYLPVLFLPMLCVLRSFTQNSTGSAAIFFYAAMLALFNYPTAFHVILTSGVNGMAIEHSAYFYGACLLLGLLCYSQSALPATKPHIEAREISSWVYLSYILTAPAFLTFFYGVFLKSPAMWQ